MNVIIYFIDVFWGEMGGWVYKYVYLVLNLRFQRTK